MFTNSILTTESYARTLLGRSANREAYATEAVAEMMVFQLQKLHNSSPSVSVWSALHMCVRAKPAKC